MLSVSKRRPSVSESERRPGVPVQTCARFQWTGIDSDSASEQVELIPIPIPAVDWPSGVDSESDSSLVLAKRNRFRVRFQGTKKSMILILESIPLKIIAL